MNAVQCRREAWCLRDSDIWILRSEELCDECRSV